MDKLSKILNLVLYALLAVTLVLTGLFYFGGEVEGAAHHTPVYTESIINWGIILAISTAGVIVIFEIIGLILQPKNALRALISAAILVVLVLIAYSISDATPLVLPGYDGSDNVPSMLLLTDTLIYIMYFLLGIAGATIVYTEISKMFK